MGLLAAHVFTGRPPIENLWPHPVISRSIFVAKQWEAPLNSHPILGWAGNVSPEHNGCGGTDIYGYRHNGDPARVVEDRAFKIFILGGSTAYGAGVCDDETVAAHLEKTLRNKIGSESIQVFNAGLGGYYSAIEFLRLSTEIAFQQPDLVISLSGTNDRPYADVDFKDLPEIAGRQSNLFVSPHHHRILDEIKVHRSLGWSLVNLAWNIGIRIRYGFGFINAVFWNKTYMGYLIAGISNRLFEKDIPSTIKNLKDYSESLSDQPPFGGSPWPEHILSGDMETPQNVSRYKKYMDQYLTVVQMTDGVARSVGANFLYVLQPSIFIENRELSDVESAARKNFVAQFSRQDYDIVGRRQYFDDLVRNNIGERNVSWLDFTNIFPDKVNAYVSMNHYSSTGNRLIAMGLAERIIECRYMRNVQKKSC